MNGNTFRNFRKQKNWSQEKFAKKLNEYLITNGIKDAKYNDRTISQWENGERDPKDIQTAYCIAQFMGISLDELYGDEISKFNIIEETIDNNNDEDHLSEIPYYAILGIYDYDLEKQCYLSRYINLYDGLVTDKTTSQLIPAKAEDHWYGFIHPDRLESFLRDAEQIGYIPEEDHKNFLCETYFDSNYDWFEEEIWSGSEYFAPWHIEGFAGCELSMADMNYNKLYTRAKYVNNDRHTLIVETHVELHISESKYLQMLKRLYNTGIATTALAVTNKDYASKFNANEREFHSAILSLDNIAKLRKIFLEYNYCC
jgi:transcriptional regulator with XRE-family HTH domain